MTARWMVAGLGAALLSTSAQAQYVPQYVPPPQAPPPSDSQLIEGPPSSAGAWRDNLIRLAVGVGGASGGYYCGYTYGYYCSSYYSLAYATLSAAGSVDLGVGPGMAISPGFQWTGTPWYSTNVNVYTPTLDFRFKSPLGAAALGRVSLGAALPITENGSVGFGGRLGFGSSFRASSGVYIGVDAMIGFGGVNGYTVGTAMLLVGPEIAF